MSVLRAEHPFQFVTQASLVELTGLKARDLRELLAYLVTVPGSVVYHHTHRFLLQHQFLSPEPPNDFAYWVRHMLQEERLGEQLAAIDTIQFSSIRALREKLVHVIERYPVAGGGDRVAPVGGEFHFMKAQTFVFPTPYQASTLQEFREAIKKVSVQSLYHHMFDARLRLGRGTNDFSHWLTHELQETDLARAIARLDPYTQPLEHLRQRIVRLVERQIQQLVREGLCAA